MNLDNAGGRKFVLAAATLLACTLLVAFKRIGDTVFAAVVIATVAAYITGNVAQKRELALAQSTSGAPQS